MVATRITRAMTEEITSDIKSVLSHQPTRERLRGVVAAELLSIKSEARAALPGVPARATFTNAISGVSPGRGVKE
jgi:hypothetical protein